MACVSVAATAQKINVSSNGDTTIVRIENSTKFLILPVEEDKAEARVKLDNNQPSDTWMDIRLAQNKTDYYVPFKLNEGGTSVVKILGLDRNALALRNG